MANQDIQGRYILIMDIVISLFASLFSVLLIRFLMNPIFGFMRFLLFWLGCAAISSFFAFLITETHKVVVRYSTVRSLGRVLAATVIKLALLIPLVYFFRVDSSYSLKLLCVTDFLMTLAALVTARVLIIIIYDDLKKDVKRDVNRLRIMVLGTNDKSVSIVTRLDNSPNYMVIGFLRNGPDNGEIIASKKVYSFKTKEDLLKLRTDLGIEGLMIQQSDYHSNMPEGFLDLLIESGIHILTVPTVSEIDYSGFTQRDIKAFSKKDDFIPDGMTSFERNFKRAIDCLLAAILLIIFSPLFIICWIAIKVGDGGPAIFKQERIGRFGRPFMIYKFRSMRLDAEKMGPALYSGDEDPRLTKVGKFIRVHHLDELPQLWNVFIGDMAFVGYRPERQYYIDQIVEHDPRYFYLYQIRPGVTSYATLNNGYTDTLDKMLRRLEYDLYYLRNRSLWFDIKVLAQTFLSIVFGKKF
ncbi:MAG: exopolysaccharide biosynthesis polyprenyl glycosylphosphotransferase [Bacteroidales bacterium]|nr:exopolysaccharide biosynthesis polyprenyl glycosylphosphotransferase [Bacteroidales bacterium]